MLTLDQCMGANRPLMFVMAESDIEVLQHLEKNHTKKNKFFVYSTTLTTTIPLSDLLLKKFNSCANGMPSSTVEVLDGILNKNFHQANSSFESYIFLDSDNFINDKQVVRKIKDILSRYQLDSSFAVSLVCISHTVSVPPSLERLSEVVFFDLPDEKALRATSDGLTKELDLKVDKDHPENSTAPSEEVIINLKGLTKFEVEQAYLQSYFMHKKIELSFIRNFKKSAIAKTDLLSLLETEITFDNIGGLSTLKKWIKKSAGGWTVEGRKFGLPQLKGLLLVGLPGSGKTLISKAIGNEWGLPIIQFDPARVFSSRVGDSESNIRRVLQIVENISPCILFIDEIEKGFAGMHSSTFSDAGVTARVIGSFLIWLQECTKPVFTVATSNNIQYLPPELIQRFDETFFVNLPQFNERKDIFNIHLKKLNRNPDKFLPEQLAQHSEHFCGREIEQALKEAMYDAFNSGQELSTEIILAVLSKKTNLLTTMAEQLNYLLKWVGWDEEKQDGIRARFANPVEGETLVDVQSQIDKMLKDIEGLNPQ